MKVVVNKKEFKKLFEIIKKFKLKNEEFTTSRYENYGYKTTKIGYINSIPYFAILNEENKVFIATHIRYFYKECVDGKEKCGICNEKCAKDFIIKLYFSKYEILESDPNNSNDFLLYKKHNFEKKNMYIENQIQKILFYPLRQS